VSEPTLYRWRDEFLAGGEAALKNGSGGSDGQQREAQQLRKQLEERDQIIGELTVANKFLKKISGQSA
jgi:transposase-like protein